MELLNEIWATARRNKLRTALTGFAVAWGIFMLIVLLGAGNGLINAQLKQRDIATTASDFKEHVDAVGAQYRTAGVISLGQQYISTQICGVYPNHTQIDKVEMMYGRFINDIDLREKRKVLVVSNKQAEELLAVPSAATSRQPIERLIGRYVNIGSFAFKVVGIYKEQENGRADAFSSYAAIKSIYGANTDDAGRIEFTFHGLPTEEANEAFEADYRQRLNLNHQAHPDDESAVWLWNRYTQNLQMETGLGILRMALWIVGLFTLLSGIVGVSNIMLITVKERTHEFGIRKAIGARPWGILKLIIIESIIITTIFGYIGMLLGVGANEWMNATIGHTQVDAGLFKATMFVDPTVGIDVCIEATIVMVIAGTIAGLVPAMKAARIRPIEALRAE